MYTTDPRAAEQRRNDLRRQAAEQRLVRSLRPRRIALRLAHQHR